MSWGLQVFLLGLSAGALLGGAYGYTLGCMQTERWFAMLSEELRSEPPAQGPEQPRSPQG